MIHRSNLIRHGKDCQAKVDLRTDHEKIFSRLYAVDKKMLYITLFYNISLNLCAFMVLFYECFSMFFLCTTKLQTGLTQRGGVMKKTIWLTALFMMLVSVNAPAEETWKITSLNWEPYSGAEMTTMGNSIQKLREILQQADIRLIVEFYPWKRAQLLAQRKDYVGYFPAWPEEVYDNFVASSAVDWSEIGVMKQSGTDISYDNIEDLFRKYNVGVVETYTYPQIIADAMQKYPKHVDQAPDEISLLKKLSIGRHPVAITDPNVMMYLAGKQGIYNVEPEAFLMKKELVVAFRKSEDNQHRILLLEKLLKQ